MLLDRNKMQPPAALRVLQPRLPRREEGEAEAKAGFEDGECAPPAPARGQAVAGEEHVLRLRNAAFGAVIDVVIGRRERRAVGGESKLRGNERGRSQLPHRASI